MTRFELFGPAHLLTLATLFGLGMGLVWVGRSGRWDRATRAILAALLCLGLLIYFVDLAGRRPLRVWDILPLHLCDMAIFVALFALVTKERRATELLYFWTTTGTLLATVTPNVREGFWSIRYLTYFTLHGGVILSALYLVLGLRLPLQKGAFVRAWLWTNVYTLVVLTIDVAFDKNYLFLLRKPRGETLLDLFGPWPIYLLVCEMIAFALFALVGRLAGASVRPSPAATQGARTCR